MASETSASWLTATELAAWMPLHGLLMTLPPLLDAQLQRDAGVSLFGYSVLATLADAPDQTLQMSELAHWTGGSLSRLSHAVAGLERREWVRRSPSPHGRRSVRATLTEAGRTRLAEIAPAHVAAVRRLVVDRVPPHVLTALGDGARAVLVELIGARSARVYDPPRRAGDDTAAPA